MADPFFFSPQQYEEYRRNLVNTLYYLNIPIPKIREIVKYADDLQRHQVPIIFDQHHLAALMGYDLDYLQVLSTCKADFYKRYEIPKRSGGMRIIDEPYPNLKEIQRWILDNILMSPGVLKEVSPVVTAFMPERDIIANASFHQGKGTVICMDLENFFPNVSWIQVFSVFYRLGYKKDVAGMLAHLCTLNESLPQGAPTSPMLSNVSYYVSARKYG